MTAVLMEEGPRGLGFTIDRDQFLFEFVGHNRSVTISTAQLFRRLANRDPAGRVRVSKGSDLNQRRARLRERRERLHAAIALCLGQALPALTQPGSPLTRGLRSRVFRGRTPLMRRG